MTPAPPCVAVRVMQPGDTETADERVRTARGPLALEALLRADFESDRARVRADIRLLGAPLVIVVPSTSLRIHLNRRLVEWSGGPCAGVEVVTLALAARKVCAAAGIEPPRGTLLFEPLVQECVRDNAVLWREIAAFEDATRAVSATLRDLYDAGFEPAHAAAAHELLADPATTANTTEERARAAALVDLAVVVAERARAVGLALGHETPRLAAEQLQQNPALLRSRAVWIYGFADATGAGLDFFSALFARADARIYYDALADAEFGTPLRTRLGLNVRRTPVAAPPVAVGLVRAAGIDAEVRAVANRIRTALDAGAVPETIAVVARDVTPYRAALRRHLGRLGIPFSSLAVLGSDGPAERRARALAVLLELRAECPLERWLDARERALGLTQEHERNAGLRALGVARVGELAALDLAVRLFGQDHLKLPLRTATAEITDDDDAIDDDQAALNADDSDDDPVLGSTRPLQRRTVPAAALSLEIDSARATCSVLEAEVGAATIAAHSARFSTFLENTLGWKADTPGRSVLERALAALLADIPCHLELEATTFQALMARALTAAIAPVFGGEGGGVAILDVTEARGRTFDDLYVLGLARGRFPRVVREDPLLGDGLRRQLAALFPDLVPKSVGRDEERVLFEALVRAARAVQLSWSSFDEQGKPLLPSALLEHVATPAAIDSAEIAADPAGVRAAQEAGVKPAHEHATLGGLVGGKPLFDALAGLALEETRAELQLSVDVVPALAAARSNILREFEPTFAELPQLGPYFGYVGAVARDDKLRQGRLYVTHLEALAGCGWQAFLRHVLGLEPPLDPAAELPDLEPRIVGNVVHDVLHKVIGTRPAHVAWPTDDKLVPMVRGAARVALIERGILLSGFEALVAARAQPMIAVARALDMREGEASGAATVSEFADKISLAAGLHGERELHFRADRVDQLKEGARYTDYKTGAPLSDAVKAETHLKRHLTGIATGRKLQAQTYAQAAGPGGVGRYLHLGESLDETHRVFAISHGDPQARELFDDALETLLGAWDMGAFLPRILQPDRARENPLCSRCEVKIACLRGDSTAHRRLAAFAVAAPDAEAVDRSAARALWSLAQRAPSKPLDDTPAPKSRRKKAP
ncbi:MAG: PD-(D/E)XK nuclease family protein [Planctomycetes bacterium]|nr:PD-(D/E)XK nuclease family protein [Planctomycetota bacterium]